MITIQIPKDHPHGVLTASPAGFPNSRAAMEHLRTAVDGHYGQAGQAFIKRLVREVGRDEARLRRRIEKRMDYFLRRASGDVVGSKSARIDKAYAMTYAAGALARRWGVLPKDWGRLLPAIREVRRSSHEVSAVLSSPSAIDRVHGYVEQHRKKLVKVSDVTVPYTRKKFEAQAGFKRLTKGHREILIPSQRFQQNFPDYKNLMAELRAVGLAQTERGNQPKLSIKAPAALCTMGRVYCIRLSGPEKRPH